MTLSSRLPNGLTIYLCLNLTPAELPSFSGWAVDMTIQSIVTDNCVLHMGTSLSALRQSAYDLHPTYTFGPTAFYLASHMNGRFFAFPQTYTNPAPSQYPGDDGVVNMSYVPGMHSRFRFRPTDDQSDTAPRAVRGDLYDAYERAVDLAPDAAVSQGQSDKVIPAPIISHKGSPDTRWTLTEYTAPVTIFAYNRPIVQGWS